MIHTHINTNTQKEKQENTDQVMQSDTANIWMQLV